MHYVYYTFLNHKQLLKRNKTKNSEHVACLSINTVIVTYIRYWSFKSEIQRRLYIPLVPTTGSAVLDHGLRQNCLSFLFEVASSWCAPGLHPVLGFNFSTSRFQCFFLFLFFFFFFVFFFVVVVPIGLCGFPCLLLTKNNKDFEIFHSAFCSTCDNVQRCFVPL